MALHTAHGQGGRADPGPWVYREIAGTNLVEVLHPSIGITLTSGEVSSWTGLYAGLTLTPLGAAQRYLYQADGSNYGGRFLPQSTASGGRMLRNLAIGSPIWLDGSRPWFMGCYKWLTTQNNSWILRSLSAGAAQAGPDVRYVSPNLVEASSNAAVAYTPDTTKFHIFESGINAAGIWTIGVDAVYGTTGSATTITGDRTQIALGPQNSVPGSLIDTVVGTLLFFKREPSEDQKWRLRRALKGEGTF